MDHPERIASAHQSLVELLRAIGLPTLIRMACRAAGIEVRELVAARERTPKLEVSGLTHAAKLYEPDLVYTVHAADGRVFEVWVFEVQLSKGWTKRWRWALYPVVYAAEFERDGLLAVFCPEPELREWIRTRLLPKIEPRPILVGPDQVPLITDYAQARTQPHLTVLGAAYHAHDPHDPELCVAAVKAAYIAIQTLPPQEARRYSVLIMSITPESVANQALDELRERGEINESRYEEFTDVELKGYSYNRGLRRGIEQGLEQGLEQGQRTQLQRGLLDVLELRGFAVPAALRERIESCESHERLEQWYASAKTAPLDRPLEALLD